MALLKFYKHRPVSRTGFSLVEIIVSIGLAAIMLPALFYGFISVRDRRYREENRLEAYVLLKELNEQIRSVKETSWNSWPASGITHYKTALSGTNFIFQSGDEISGNFKRYFTLSDVYRNNTTGGIVTTGGVLDKSTKKIQSYVTWGSGGTTNSVTSTKYYSRYLNSGDWIKDTKADFDTGTYANTQSTSTGEITLSQQSGGGSWASPALTATVDTTGKNNAMEVEVVDGYAYITYLGTPGLAIVNVSNPASPVATGYLNLGSNIYGVEVVGNYAFLATSTDKQELTVVNITNKAAPTQAATLDLTGTKDSRGIALYGNYVLIPRLGGAEPEIEVTNISNPLVPTLTASYQDSSFNYFGISVSGHYAYAASSDDSGELKIIDLSNVSSPTKVASVNLPGTADGTDVAVYGNYAFVSTMNNTSGGELYVVDVTNPASPVTKGSYEVSANVNGVYTSDGNLVFLATTSSSAEFIVLDTTNKSSPVLTGSYNMTAQANGVYVSGSYAYVVGLSDTAELTIFKGASTSTYYTSGTYESEIKDLTTSEGFNYVTADTTFASNATVSYQIAVSDVNNAFTYVGPGGTSSLTDVYTTDGPVPILYNTGRYFRFKVYFTSNGTATPTFNYFKVNYAQ